MALPYIRPAGSEPQLTSETVYDPQSQKQTNFLTLPRELRKSILLMAHGHDIVKYDNYFHFLDRDRTWNDFCYHNGVRLGFERWLRDIGNMDERLEANVEYVKEQYKKAYLAVNGEYVRQYRGYVECKRILTGLSNAE